LTFKLRVLIGRVTYYRGGVEMKTRFLALVLALALCLTAMVFVAPHNALSRCTDFRILTVNLLFSEIQERPQRLQIIADFVKNQAEPIDVILLQEVVGGSLFQTPNSARDLQKLLAASPGGTAYYLNSRVEEGVPGVALEGNALLSRHKIVFSINETLPFVEIVDLNGVLIPLRRIVTLNRINVANYGKVDVYNTHLCSSCSPLGRATQVDNVLNFIQTIEKLIPGDNPIILGGDFNLNLYNQDQISLGTYNKITNSGFLDTYSAVNGENFTCCNPSSGAECCTFAVPGNPYAIDFLTHLPEVPQRLDYIFAKWKRLAPHDVISSEVVFNKDPNWVSDHSGVLTTIKLP
jgi:maltose 6'-phosphate phosphatase